MDIGYILTGLSAGHHKIADCHHQVHTRASSMDCPWLMYTATLGTIAVCTMRAPNIFVVSSQGLTTPLSVKRDLVAKTD